MIYSFFDKIKHMFVLVKFLLLPNLCLVCKNTVFSQDDICLDCWHKLEFITSQTCSKCLERLSGTDVLLRLNHLPVCPKCYRQPPFVDHAKAVFSYTKEIRTLIIKFKHNDSTELSMFFAKLMANTGQELFTKSDLIIPIPIHNQKMRKRKYNQAFLLAKYLSKITGDINKLQPNILYKSKPTRPQEGRTSRQRTYNIKNSFSLKNPDLIYNKNILIIDDVHTTGSTLNECAKILKKAGANQIYTLTIAKVQKDATMSVYDVGM